MPASFPAKIATPISVDRVLIRRYGHFSALLSQSETSAGRVFGCSAVGVLQPCARPSRYSRLGLDPNATSPYAARFRGTGFLVRNLNKHDNRLSNRVANYCLPRGKYKTGTIEAKDMEEGGGRE